MFRALVIDSHPTEEIIMANKSMWRVRKGSQLVVGMTLRFGNVTYRIVSIEDGMVYVQHTLGLVPFDHFALGARQSYKVLVDETNTPIIR